MADVQRPADGKHSVRTAGWRTRTGSRGPTAPHLESLESRCLLTSVPLVETTSVAAPDANPTETALIERQEVLNRDSTFKLLDTTVVDVTPQETPLKDEVFHANATGLMFDFALVPGPKDESLLAERDPLVVVPPDRQTFDSQVVPTLDPAGIRETNVPLKEKPIAFANGTGLQFDFIPAAPQLKDSFFTQGLETERSQLETSAPAERDAAYTDWP